MKRFTPRLKTLQWLLVVLRVLCTPQPNRPPWKLAILSITHHLQLQWPPLSFSRHHTHYHLLDLYLLCPLPGTFFSQIYLRMHVDIQTNCRSPETPSLASPCSGTHCPIIALFHLCPSIYHCLNSHTCLFYWLTGFQRNIKYTSWEQELTSSYSPLWPQLPDLCLDRNNLKTEHRILKKCLLNECPISFLFLREEYLWDQHPSCWPHSPG